MLAYSEFGEGPPVILLHGLLGSKTNMTGVARMLADRFHTFALDMRNHGDSFHHPLMTYGTMAADIGGFMADHDIDTASIVGHSMGGKCAMQLALSFCERIDKLVVVDIAPKTYEKPFWVNYLKAMRSVDLDKLTSRSEADRLLQRAIPDPVYRQFLLTNLKKSAGGKFSWRPNLEAISASQTALTAGVDGSACDVQSLFIRGGRSEYVADEDKDMIEQLFPNSNLVTLGDAGHLVHIEARDTFNQLLSDFL